MAEPSPSPASQTGSVPLIVAMASGTTARARRQTRRLRLVRARLRTAIASFPVPLAIVLAVALVQSVAWDVSLPTFQGPDELAHFSYVQRLAETGELPNVTGLGNSDSTETQEAVNRLNLGTLTNHPRSKPAWSAADLRRWHQVERSLPRGARANGAGGNPVAKNPPLYYAAMSIPYRLLIWLPLLKRLFILRLFSALFYLATICVTWLLAGEIFGKVRWKQVLSAGAVALQPQLAFMSIVINADILLVALTSGVLLASVRMVKFGPSLKRVLLASGLTAAAVLTHGRGLVTVPVLLVALAVSVVRHRYPLRDALRGGAAAAATLAAAGLAYVLFGRARGGSYLYGGQVSALNGGRGFNLGRFLSFGYQFYLPKLSGLDRRVGPAYGYRQVFIDTFYGGFGSLEVALRPRMYDALEVLSALGLVGLYTAVVVRWRRLRGSWPVVSVLLALLVTNLIFLPYVSYRALLSTGGRETLIVGRYLLPMVALFGLAITFTVASLPRRLAPAVGAAVLALGVLVSLTGIGLTMTRFYA